MATPLVSILMGSKSDLDIMQAARDALAELGVEHEVRVLSAHRTPDALFAYVKDAEARGVEVFIAGAGGAAHLAGALAAATSLPVIGVPIALPALSGLDSLLSMVQMPRGVPVATVGIDGARNAGLLAARMIGITDERVAGAVVEFQQRLARDVRARDASLQSRIGD